jgi:hypothetical protein
MFSFEMEKGTLFLVKLSRGHLDIKVCLTFSQQKREHQHRVGMYEGRVTLDHSCKLICEPKTYLRFIFNHIIRTK